MKTDWQNARPGIKMVLAVMLVIALLATPLTTLPQAAQAQCAPAARTEIAVVGASGATLYATPDGEVLGSLPWARC